MVIGHNRGKASWVHCLPLAEMSVSTQQHPPVFQIIEQTITQPEPAVVQMIALLKGDATGAWGWLAQRVLWKADPPLGALTVDEIPLNADIDVK